MSPIAAILILLLLAAVILVIAAPLRGRDADTAAASSTDTDALAAMNPQGPAAPTAQAVFEREELEAAREAKYREIRDSELDFRTGKLSQDDYASIDAQLRAEAIDILNRLEQLGRADEEGSGRQRGDADGTADAAQDIGDAQNAGGAQDA
jgi:uncharacterized membrane protein YdfJ with MMPL/SSD domain